MRLSSSPPSGDRRVCRQERPERNQTPASQPAPTLTEADIRAALCDCYDPAVNLNIVDLGLVHSIAIAPDPDAPGANIPGVPARHRVRIALTVAQILDPESDGLELIAQIQNRLAAFETVSGTEVVLLDSPAWTPDRISEQGRSRLAHRLTSKEPQRALGTPALASRKPEHDLVQIQIGPAKA